MCGPVETGAVCSFPAHFSPSKSKAKKQKHLEFMETITNSPSSTPLDITNSPAGILLTPEVSRASREIYSNHEKFEEQHSAEKSDRNLILIIENQETKRFSAMMKFELAGVAFNGCSKMGKASPENLTTGGDHLLSRLLPTLDSSSAVEFVFSGGGVRNFSWCINGLINDAASRNEALNKAKLLRQNLLLVLGSEPTFRFEGRRCEDQPAPCPNEFRCVSLHPKRVCLDINRIASVGFTNPQDKQNQEHILLSFARPLQSARSFNSLAEAVILSPLPVFLTVRFNRFDLTPADRKQIADALNWVKRSRAALEKQLAEQQLDSSTVETTEALLNRWLNSPQGIRTECNVISEDELPASYLAMLGGDALGSAVSINGGVGELNKSNPQKGKTPEAKEVLRLENCQPTGAYLPSLFPAPDSLHRTRIRRHYNLVPPDLERDGMLLGTIREGGIQSVRFDQTARSRHLYVLGATGTGKSTLLSNMIFQDIREGRGVCLIDPHGDLYDQIVEFLPLNRAKDVVMFNPGNSENVPGLNILECSGPNRHLQVNFAINELLKTFDRMYDMRQAGGPMFETYFRNALLLLLESDLPEVTIMELSLVFESRDYRQFLLGRCKNPVVVGFWKDIAEKVSGEASLSSIAPYIICKLNAFTYNALIRPILGQAKSTIDFRQIMDRQNILLIKLPKGLLGESDAQLLGSFILARIFSAAMGRTNVPESKRPPFHLYVDEFQNFVNDGVAFMLAEARKFGLYLTLANQNLSQLAASQGRQNLVDAVLGNVGSLIAFRTGPPDAEKLRIYTEPEFGPMDLQGLPNYHAVGRILTSNGPTRPFIFRTLPKNWSRPQKKVNNCVWDLREQSHGRPVAEVEAAIAARRAWRKAPATDTPAKQQASPVV